MVEAFLLSCIEGKMQDFPDQIQNGRNRYHYSELAVRSEYYDRCRLGEVVDIYTISP